MQESPTICFCFDYTEADIVEDVHRNDSSLIMEKIKTAKQFGQCQCTTKNPQGK